MQRRPSISRTFIFMGWILFFILSTPLFPQAQAEYGKKAADGLKVPDIKPPSASGFLRDVDVIPGTQGVKVELIGDRLISAIQSFTLSQPPRLVIDFPNVFSSYPKKFIALNHSLLTDIRFGQHPGKLRVVFIFPGTEGPSLEIAKESKGLTIWVGKVEEDSAGPPKLISEEKKKNPSRRHGREKASRKSRRSQR